MRYIQYMNNQWTTSPLYNRPKCYAKSSTVQDAFWPIPGPISRAGTQFGYSTVSLATPSLALGLATWSKVTPIANTDTTQSWNLVDKVMNMHIALNPVHYYSPIHHFNGRDMGKLISSCTLPLLNLSPHPPSFIVGDAEVFSGSHCSWPREHEGKEHPAWQGHQRQAEEVRKYQACLVDERKLLSSW